ncbi:Neuroligin-1 [Melipona quadrifasciata]|uniref:Neuroligin-1 n=1 Tax=Melipona quadrifasciata TaxID=166423 RepID=A0A0M9AA95_9HYME|nr:Neuroligin-1 [Melipona quadrifasciata]
MQSYLPATGPKKEGLVESDRQRRTKEGEEDWAFDGVRWTGSAGLGVSGPLVAAELLQGLEFLKYGFRTLDNKPQMAARLASMSYRSSTLSSRVCGTPLGWVRTSLVGLVITSVWGMADNSRKHPVVLYIHGESYDWGSGNPYDGSVLASYTDQVIVTMNYRLGVLGFLNANMAPQTKARVANYGLMDQIAALQWVKEHIALFGGDPNNVTLMGQGTGAACVHFLAISPTVVRGLFKRAILLSGSALSSWAVVEDPVSYAMKLAKAVNCSIPEDLLKDNELIVDCLRDRSLDELMQVDVQPPTFLSAFGPSVDGVVIKPDFQKDLLSYMGPEFQGFGPLPKKAEHGAPITSNNKYDLLFGVTTSEALWKFAEKDVQQGFEGERRDRIIRTYVRNAYVYHLTEIFYTVVNEYTDWERTVQHPVNTKDACVQALSDAQFVAPLVQTGDLFTLRHTKKPNNPHIAPIPESEKEPLPKTYFYVFDYQMKDGDYPQRCGAKSVQIDMTGCDTKMVGRLGDLPKHTTRKSIGYPLPSQECKTEMESKTVFRIRQFNAAITWQRISKEEVSLQQNCILNAAS